MNNVIVQGDALRLPLRDESVDLIVTSPPYFAQRSYQDRGEHYDGQVGSEITPGAFLEALWACTAEWQRVLKKSGSLWVNLGDKYAGSGGHNNAAIVAAGNKHARPGKDIVVNAERRNAPSSYNKSTQFEGVASLRNKSLMGLPWRYALGCVDGRAGEQLVLRAEVVWSKPNGLPESVTDRVRRSHEQWFHFTKEGSYYSALDDIREVAVSGDRRPGGGSTYRKMFAEGEKDTNLADATPHPLGKLPGSVWSIPTEPLVVSDEIRAFYDLPEHFAAFPTEWPRRLILGWSPAGICCECGQGRRLVVTKEGLGAVPRAKRHLPGYSNPAGEGQRDMTYTVVGETCGCVEPTGPVRPAVVLDPFSGTGTVAGVARALGRTGIGVDLSHDYCRLANYFLKDGRRFAKAVNRTNAERQGALL